MRIVHTVYGMDMGGMEVLVAQLCRQQRSQGHEVRVFAYSKLGVLGEQLVSEGFDVYVPGEAHPFLTMWRYLTQFRRSKPDVVHSHGVAPTIHAVLPARLAHVPVVLSTRHRVELFPYNRSSELRYNLMGWLCSWVTGICEVTAMQIKAGPFACKRKIISVYNGMNPVVGGKGTTLSKQGFTILFVGRLMPEKRLETLIRAVSSAKKKVPKLKLWIVGGGKLRAELEGLVDRLGIRDSVVFWGQQMDTAPFFLAADLFSMSSVNEGLPLSLLQSMSVGLPSVTTDVDGMGEVLRLTGGGLLVPEGDAEAFGNALVRVASDPELRETLSAKALSGYERDFTFELMASRYMTLYRGEAIMKARSTESEQSPTSVSDQATPHV